jgi:recombinational DNA repair protein (RecF pathway)
MTNYHNINMKKCSGCGATKELSGFHKGKSQCKECRKNPNPKDVEIARLKKELAKLNALVKILMDNCKGLGKMLDQKQI